MLTSTDDEGTSRPQGHDHPPAFDTRLRQLQKLETLGWLTSGVAHDLNNLMTVLLGYSHLVLSELAPDDRLRTSVQEIVTAAERSAALTRQLLDFTRRREPGLKPVNLTELITELHGILRRLVGEHVQLIPLLDEDVCPVLADPVQLEQVLFNLVANAGDAMPRGGALTIFTANVTPQSAPMSMPGWPPREPRVLLAVQDSGRGMDAETVDHLFEPFFTTKYPGKGTGLGLTIVKEIVEQHQGTIHVSSSPGTGSTFAIYLPLATQTSLLQTAPPPPTTRQGGTETIFLVEDNEQVVGLLADALRREGYTVLTAGDGSEAWHVAGEYEGSIELLLTDVVLPRLDGPELADQLRIRRPGLKVLYMSGFDPPTLDRRGLGPERSAFIQKPFITEGLIRRVREVLDTG